MTVLLDASASRASPPAFARPGRRPARGARPTSARRSRRSWPAVAARRRCGAARAHASASTGCTLTRDRAALQPERDRRRPRRAARRAAGGARASRPRGSAPSTTASCRADASWIDAAGRPARPALAPLDAVGLYVPGRHGRLSQLGADERDPGQGRRRAADRHGGADARRRAQPAGAGRGRHRRRRRDLPDRRRPGGGGAGLRHGDDRPGRQDRRARATPTSPRPSGRSSARSAST